MNVSEPTFRLSKPASVTDQFSLFEDQLTMKNEDCVRIRAEIIKDLKPSLEKTFGLCQISFFGSMLTGSALVGSDVDMSVTTDDSHCTIMPTKDEMETKVCLSANALYSNGKFTCVNPITHARFPILSVLHVPTNTKCDISFSNFLGNEDGQLLRFYFNLHPRFLEVMRVIKFWAKKNGICNGKDYISSYGWNLLFIGYLQTLKFDGTNAVPSVLEMQPPVGVQEKKVQGYRVDFTPPYHYLPLPDEFSHLKILHGFFEYYKSFSYNQYILCPYLGTKVSRYGAQATSDDPRVVRHVKCLRANLTKSATTKFLRIIQDLFTHERFVVCRTLGLSRVNSCMVKAASLCEGAMNESPDSESKFLEVLFS